MNLHEFIHSPAITCTPATTLADAAAEMDRYNVGSLVVIDVGDQITGILTDRDLVVRGMAKRREPDTPVREVMTPNVVSLREDADPFDAAHQMATSGCRRLPVVGIDGALRGVIALDDLMILFARQTDELAHAVAWSTTSPLPRP
jgi:CBS domain-containing protein